MPSQVPYWIDTPYHPRPALKGMIRADVAIIGGGITGISAAYHLQKRGFSTVILEKGSIGQGASSKNAGMVLEGTEHDFNDLRESEGLRQAKIIWGFTQRARDYLKNIIKKEQIPCQSEQTGSLFAALNPRQSEMIKNEWRARKSAGLRCKILTGDALDEHVSSTFDSALYTPEDFGMNPVRYIRQLAKRAQHAGARIFENSPALRRSPGTIATPHGRVDAKDTFIALESYNPAAKAHQSRFKPMQLIATAPLSPSAYRRLGTKGGQLIWDGNIDYHTCRIVGKRVLIGRDLHPHQVNPQGLESHKHDLLKTLLRFFPKLRSHDIKVSHQWHGSTVHVKQAIPRIGEYRGAHHAFGFGGNGLTQGTLAGRIFAEYLDGKKIPSIYAWQSKPLDH